MLESVLQHQVAIVTGGSSGIGAATAVGLADAGAAVLVNYSGNDERAQKVVQQIRGNGGLAEKFKADVSKERDVSAMFEYVADTFDRLDILVNNAGIQKDAPFLDMTLEQWNEVIAVNLTGQFLCARAAARVFVRQGVHSEISSAAGKIIGISSVHETIPWAGRANYAASKSGSIQLTMTMAQELARHKIRVNSIAPGAIKTPINRSSWEDADARDRLLERIPYGRIGEPEDIARAVVWLASDQADYVHGTTLFVDGGMTLYPAFASDR